MAYENPPSNEEIEVGVKNLLRIYDRLPDCTTAEQAKSLAKHSGDAAHQAVETRGAGGMEQKPIGLG